MIQEPNGELLMGRALTVEAADDAGAALVEAGARVFVETRQQLRAALERAQKAEAEATRLESARWWLEQEEKKLRERVEYLEYARKQEGAEHAKALKALQIAKPDAGARAAYESALGEIEHLRAEIARLLDAAAKAKRRAPKRRAAGKRRR